MVEQGIKTVGIDSLSLEKLDSDGLVHKKLLSSGIIILEGLVLDVKAKNYFLIAPPLKIEGADGTPLRAVLLEKER